MGRKNGNGSPLTREEFLAYVKHSDERFGQVDRRFEQVDRRFEQVFVELRAMREEMADQRHWTEVVVGGLQRRAGRNLEDMVAGCLRVALDMKDIRKEGLQMRRRVLDDKGDIGPPGREYEIDLYAHDGKCFLFEVKSYAEPEDVQRFDDKATLAARKWRLKNPGKVLVTLEKSRDVQAMCRSLGVTLV